MSSEQEKQKTISSSKEISFTPFLTNILKPSAEMAGQELKGYLKDKIDTWKEKRRSENIAEHVNRVQEEIDKKPNNSRVNNSINQLELFTEWAEGAQDIDANEGVIAKLWQKLLIEIASGDSINRDLIGILKKLNPEEAKLLLEVGARGSLISKSERDLHYLESLEKMGLVKPINIIPIVVIVLSAWFLLMFLAVSYKEFFGDYGLVLKSSNLELVFFGFPLLIAAVTGYQMYRKKRLYKWRLSWIGSELVKGVDDIHP